MMFPAMLASNQVDKICEPHSIRDIKVLVLVSNSIIDPS